MSIKRMMIALGVTISLLLAGSSLTQPLDADFDLSWYTVDGGGTMLSSGGEFTLGGTIGQPDACVMTGGEFELSGGFWPGTLRGGCNGNEKITKAKCKTRGGKVKKVVVVVKKATPGADYTAKLDTGEELIEAAKSSGKVKFKFKGDNAPPCGPNGVTVCDKHKGFDCGC